LLKIFYSCDAVQKLKLITVAVASVIARYCNCIIAL